MSEAAAPAFAAADWGTTRLRLWLMDEEGGVLAERRSDEGMLVAATAGFPQILEKHLAAMDAPPQLPVIICGMAGARQGWAEAPYEFAPASLRDILGRSIPAPHADRPVRIIPGVAQRESDAPDVMRGEETQLAGAGALLEGSALVCMPGTHSKWVEVENGAVVRFSTWLTGELFALLSSSSILRHAVDASADVAPESAPFLDWLRRALAAPEHMSSMLFRIRAAGLLQGLSPPDAAAALSGLLIGCEIGSARRRFRAPNKIMLISSGPLGRLYETALREAGFDVVLEDAEEAVRTGLFEAGRRNFLQTGGERR